MGASGERDRSASPAEGGPQGARRPDRSPWFPHVILSRADGGGARRAAHGAGSGTEPERPARPGCPARAAAHRPSSWWAVGPTARGRAWRTSLEAHSTTFSWPVGGLIHSITAIYLRHNLLSQQPLRKRDRRSSHHPPSLAGRHARADRRRQRAYLSRCDRAAPAGPPSDPRTTGPDAPVAHPRQTRCR